MKSKIPMIVALALLALSTFSPQLSTCFAQGSLTPPGPPSPTMTSLSQVMTSVNQVEPRTPISAPYNITKPGSYYLSTNITVTTSGDDAIDIRASGVTLDLNGFTISSTGSGGTAIYISFVSIGGSYIGFTDITICNGHITGGVTNNAGVYGGLGFDYGIRYFQAPPAPPYNVRVTGVTVSGCANYGINVGTGNSSVVESCTVNSVGGSGIIASSVNHSTAYQCGNTAISADNASDCYAYSTGGDGLDASYAANNCYGDSSSGYGLYVSQGNANNCFGYSFGGVGLYAGSNAENCSGYSTDGDGLNAANAANNCYGNSIGAVGLDASTVNNCYGNSLTGTGLTAYIANSCIGSSNIGTGLDAAGVAIGCYCFSGAGVAITAHIANSCMVGGGTTNITYKYNMP
jgi:hypothetical protein